VAAQVNWDIPRDTPQSKVEGLLGAVDDMQAEMRHRFSLTRIPGLMWASNQLDLLRNISFILAAAINALILLSFGTKNSTGGLPNQE
jgi:hypothetical protein